MELSISSSLLVHIAYYKLPSSKLPNKVKLVSQTPHYSVEIGVSQFVKVISVHSLSTTSNPKAQCKQVSLLGCKSIQFVSEFVLYIHIF